jgi:pyruvate formate lyase activating enzyme
MNKKILVTNIQRMCFHDGPGIRTTVFLKGCSIHCPWCSNPENISFKPEPFELDGKSGTYGKIYEAAELIRLLTKDKCFWGEEGGVTFSGGEALMQADLLEDTFAYLKKQGVNLAVETAGFVPERNVDIALKYIDYFFVDVKILDETICRGVLGGHVRLYLSNVDKIYYSGKNMTFRIPCNYEHTMDRKNIELLEKFLLKYRDVKIQIFSIHNLGANKYKSLNKEIWQYEPVSEEDLNGLCDEFKSIGLDTEIIRI